MGSSYPVRMNATFGTWRGGIRLALSHVQMLGLAASDPARARRLVFVCHGNICRSAYAEAAARRLGAATASFGLSATAGAPAHPPVIAAAAARGIDLAVHRATPLGDFVPAPGDLFLVMEVRQLARLRRDQRFRDAAMDLLGRHAGTPHIHDPYELSDAYLETCLNRIDRAVAALVSRAGSTAS